MPTEILTKYGTPIVWADTTDYTGTISGLARTHQIDLTSLADAAARQGAKADLGAVRARKYAVLIAIEFDVAPVSGTVVEIYWAGSPASAAGNANPGGASGADAAYTGTAGDSLADSVQQLRWLGNLICTADAATVVQYMVLSDLEGDIPRYGMPVIKNEGGQAFEGDAVEMYFALIPLIDESQ